MNLKASFIFDSLKFIHIYMKKLILTLVLGVITFAVTAQPQKKTTQPPKKEQNSYLFTDFREVKWGAHVDSIYRGGVKLEFVKAPEMADKNAYVLADENLIMGTVNLDKIYYIFNKQNRFVGVIMIGRKDLDGRKQFGEMKYILTYKFRDPELREVPGAIQYYWNIDDVRITLDDQDSKGLFVVEFYSDFERSESKRINMSVNDF